MKYNADPFAAWRLKPGLGNFVLVISLDLLGLTGLFSFEGNLAYAGTKGGPSKAGPSRGKSIQRASTDLSR